jgi:Protein of unknown function (DUF4058)
MPSPFPGMDPFIESQDWEDFHTRFVTELGNALVPRLRPRYETRIERRVYVARATGEPARIIIPDVAVLSRSGGALMPSEPDQASAAATATLVETEVNVRPVRCRLPVVEEHREAFLTIRRTGTREIVTVIEVLSPDNKHRGHKGRRKYLKKRQAVLDSPASLVELDLLRGGARLPMGDPLPPGDYYALVSRDREPEATVYAWTLRQAMRTVMIPLTNGDPDVPLDVQAIFTTVYDRAGYDYSLDYRSSVHPPLSDNDASWAASMLESMQGQG